MKDNLRVVVITSFPTIGNAGLKNIAPILGTYIIPVPTLILSGLGNMEGHQKFEVSFEEILNETLEMAQKQNYRLVLYVGYLKNSEQIGTIAVAISKFDHIIDCVVVDPVCGDAGKAYVDRSIIEGFPQLLKLAHVAIPNETELRLLNGSDFQSDLDDLQNRMLESYPDLKLITTGILHFGSVCNQIICKSEQYETRHKWIDKHVSGTGDAFAALFIWYHFIEQTGLKAAIQITGDALSELIETNLTSGNGELHISLSTFSINTSKQLNHE